MARHLEVAEKAGLLVNIANYIYERAIKRRFNPRQRTATISEDDWLKKLLALVVQLKGYGTRQSSDLEGVQGSL